MTSDLRDLYQQVILDHNRKPRNFHTMPDADRKADGFNPLCGDKITVYLRVSDRRIEQVSFEGSGCAISQASASMMTEAIKGKTIEEAEALFGRFHDLVTGEPREDGAKSAGADGNEALLGKLEVFQGVSEFPARVKCASLAWHTLKAALHEQDTPVSTE